MGGEEVYGEKIAPMKVMKKKFTHKKGSKELFVIFPPWRSHLYYNLLVKRQLLKNDCSVLEYEFPAAILSSNWKFTLKYFNFICSHAVKEIKRLKNKYKFQKLSMIGVSLGCVNACMCARVLPLKTQDLFLIAPGHCLAESMWEGISTQKIRKSYESKNISLKELKKHWHKLAPENNLSNLKCDNISIFLSKSDRVIPFRCGKILLDKLKLQKCNISYENEKLLGHYLTAFLFYIYPKKFLLRKVGKT